MRWPRWPRHDASDLSALAACLAGDAWSRGEAVARFEAELARECGSRHCVLVSSATEGLRLALLALHVGSGDEVIVPGLTWPSTAWAALACGATLVLADVEPDTYALAPDAVRRLLGPRTRAVIPVHLYCSTADVEALCALTAAAGVALVEDAAQALGGRLRGRALGTFGAAGVFSFQQKKLVTSGEGGAIVTDDDALHEQLLALRDHGLVPGRAAPLRCSGHSRLSSLDAALLRAQLARLGATLREEEAAALRLAARLDGVAGVRCLARRPAVERQCYYSFCFRVADPARAARVRRCLAAELGGEFTASYPPLSDPSFFCPDLEPAFRGLLRADALDACRAAPLESVRFPHWYLLAGDAALDRIAAVVEREAAT